MSDLTDFIARRAPAIGAHLARQEMPLRAAFGECGSDPAVHVALIVGDDAELGRLVRAVVQRDLRVQAESVAEGEWLDRADRFDRMGVPA